MTAQMRLTADTIFTVAKSGGGDFNDIPDAVHHVCFNVDCAGYKVCIQVAPGTYTNPVQLFDVLGVDKGGWEQKKVLLRGDPDNLGTVKLTVNNVPGAIWTVNCTTGWFIEGFEISNPLGSCINSHAAGSIVYCGKNLYSDCGQGHLHSTYGAFLELCDDYQIAGNALYHFVATQGGRIVGTGKNATIIGQPTFSQSFLYCTDFSYVLMNGHTWTGTANGTKYRVGNGGFTNTGGKGINYFPGSIAGISNYGNFPGWYI